MVKSSDVAFSQKNSGNNLEEKFSFKFFLFQKKNFVVISHWYLNQIVRVSVATLLNFSGEEWLEDKLKDLWLYKPYVHV